MKDFNGKIAVITGGGSGMGRELARQLVAAGASVAFCDVSEKTMRETVALCEADGVPQGVKITTHIVDVSDEAQVLRFRDEVQREHDTDKVHLVINNAGIGGGGSLFTDSRESWERTFGVCWTGVYLMTRAFLPLLVRADEGHLVNTSSVNGFWASLGAQTPHTAYSAAKFAVKGFTEALITDLRINAPHVTCSVVMPGHIGTDIVRNSRLVLAGGEGAAMSAEDLGRARQRMARAGMDPAAMSDAQIETMVDAMADAFRDNAPTSAAEAARIILDGVKAEHWRILVGADAERLDARVRADPETVYDADFVPPFNFVAGGARGETKAG
jgi:NAD(P)-dependent dehydrogenase (short-subunit alcohol dehydrogenase family)